MVDLNPQGLNIPHNLTCVSRLFNYRVWLCSPALAILAVGIFLGAAGCSRQTTAGSQQSAADAKPQFMSAISQHDTETVKSLLAKFPELAKTTNEYNVPILNTVIGTGNSEIVALLLQNGADANGGTDPPILTALARDHNFAEVKLLIDAGANVNVNSGSLKLTALMKAANYGDMDCVRALVEKGADVNAKDTAGGFTVLHHAVFGGNADVVSYLLKKGAKPDVKDASGQTPLEMAVAASAPVETDEQQQADVTALAKTDPAAAMKLASQNAARKVAAGPLQGKDLTAVIAALRQGNQQQ